MGTIAFVSTAVSLALVFQCRQLVTRDPGLKCAVKIIWLQNGVFLYRNKKKREKAFNKDLIR